MFKFKLLKYFNALKHQSVHFLFSPPISNWDGFALWCDAFHFKADLTFIGQVKQSQLQCDFNQIKYSENISNTSNNFFFPLVKEKNAHFNLIEAKFPLGLLNRQEKKKLPKCNYEQKMHRGPLELALTPASKPAGLATADGHHFAGLFLFDSLGCWVVFRNRSK